MRITADQLDPQGRAQEVFGTRPPKPPTAFGRWIRKMFRAYLRHIEQTPSPYYYPPPPRDVWAAQNIPRPVPGYGDPIHTLYRPSPAYRPPNAYGGYEDSGWFQDRTMMHAQGYRPTSLDDQWLFRDGPLPGGPMWNQR